MTISFRFLGKYHSKSLVMHIFKNIVIDVWWLDIHITTSVACWANVLLLPFFTYRWDLILIRLCFFLEWCLFEWAKSWSSDCLIIFFIENIIWISIVISIFISIVIIFFWWVVRFCIKLFNSILFTILLLIFLHLLIKGCPIVIGYFRTSSWFY